MWHLTEIKLKQRKAGFFLTVAMAALLLHAPVVHADICSEGSGIPPFLSSSVDPNMLLVIDNSGSMLDMAYIDEDTDGGGADKKDQCFDDNYDPAINYVGYFETDDWYVWELGATPWTSTKDMVNDPWVATWEQGTNYTAGEIVYANGALYRAETSDVSNDPNPRNGYNLSEDEGVSWEAVSQSDTVSELTASCTDDDLVSYDDMVYVCDGGIWERLEGGQFSRQDTADALSVCSDATGDKYSQDGEICITVTDETIFAAPPLPEVIVQTSMQAFAARGNFLNWASSSKFDIQKKILTGGKYNSAENQLIGESRGCAGSGFVKQVAVTAAADSSTNYLVMRIRGANSEDMAGSVPEDRNTDDTTRLEIVGLSSAGFDITACQEAVETLQQNDIDQCLGSANEVGISQAALSIAVNICRQISVPNPGLADVPNLATTVADKCEDLFTTYGYTPSTMSPEDGGYVCYGIYDAWTFPDSRDRVGYLGRCWNGGTAANCNAKLEVSDANGGCDRGSDPRCTYCSDGSAVKCADTTIFKNEGGYNYQCTDVKGNDSQGYYCAKDHDPSDWELLYVLMEVDVDGDGHLDVAEDLDGDGKLDVAEDIDGDGRLDVNEDKDNDGNLDVNEDLDGDGNVDINEDLNGDGVWSVAEPDVDGDGTLDLVDEDLDGDGNLDVDEDLDSDGNLDLDEDLDGDGNLDVAEDLDGDSNLDVNEDLDGDGNLDVNEDLNGDGLWSIGEVDADGDGNLDLVDEDLDGDGNLDVDEDLNDNGVLDFPLEVDWDLDGKLDLVDEDLNGDGNLDVNEDLNGDGLWTLAEVDADGDGNLDLANEDLDGDGHLDVDEDVDGDGHLDVAEDLDGDGNLDIDEDVDGDGKLDLVNEDKDSDGNLDVNEDLNGDGLWTLAEVDADGDGNLDSANEDIDGDGKLDLADEDLDGDGHLDVAEDLDGDGHLDVDEDVDGDGHLDVDEDQNGDGVLGQSNIACLPGDASTGAWVPDWGSSSDFANDPNLECIGWAIIDFCGNLKVPEVIDPSDQATTTSDYWNVPAMLIDSGALSQMGLAKPLAVMKSLIQYDQPQQQQNEVHAAERPDGPRGILFDVSPDLRIGAMSFRDNGSKTECDALAIACSETAGQFDECITDQTSTACAECVAARSIIKHCPATNKDGAQVISQITLGMYMDDQNTPGDDSDDLEVWNHYISLVSSINETRATSWTPLAEAIYSAMGYFGQNTAFRIDADDFRTEVENSAWPDPVKYWCQDNHILIITEGASTADVNADVETLANLIPDTDDPDAVTDATCTNGLDGSTYLDDMTYFGKNATVSGATVDSSNLYIELIATEKDDPIFAKQPVTTHIVTTGSLRTDGTGECSPTTLMTNAATNGGTSLYSGDDPAQLEANLRQALNDILNRASAGSAASVISSSRSGEGAAYQAVFWPKTSRGLGDVDPLSWIGDVHSMFVDTRGALWDDYSGGTGSTENSYGRKWSEDSNGNGRLDAGENVTGGDTSCLDGDRRMFFYYDSVNSPKGTKICFNDSVLANPAAPVCDPSLTDYCQSTPAFVEPVEIRKFDQYLWSANETLANIDDASITHNRGVDSTTGKWAFDTTDPKRYIFTWNDLDDDGVVDSDGLFGTSVSNSDDEIIELDNNLTNWTGKNSADHSVVADFRVDSAEMPLLVNWLRGSDSNWETDINSDSILDPAEDINGNGIRDYVYRCRRFPDCEIVQDANNPSARTQPLPADNPVWRLGDVIHSTPKLVAQPSEGFQTVYRDVTYSSFIKKYRFRRHVIYFGANDGMLHAVNGGFFDEDNHQFFKNSVSDATTHAVTLNNDTGPALGHELWAYIPYNLQPHLKCMTDQDYVHKYYVDHEPRIFDVQIWEEEPECATDIYNNNCIHPKGWGTILVGSMRFGGSPVDVSSDANWDSGDTREFVSSYFIMDITDPERPPTLLGEMTMNADVTNLDGNPYNFTDLGYTTSMPTMVVMRGADGADSDSHPDTTWYLVMGKGPTTLKGQNDEQGKLAILPLSRLVGTSRTAFRFIDALPSVGGYTGAAGDAGDTFPVPGGNDYDVPASTNTFIGDLITVDLDIEQKAGPDGALYKSDAVYFGTVDGNTFTTPEPITNPEKTVWPGNGSLWRLVTKQVNTLGIEQVTTPDDWYLSKLINSLGPITAAPTIGWDGDNIWIYVGTGRFFANEDKTDDRNQYYYGIKEPRNGACEMSWDTIDWVGNRNTAPFTVDPSEVAGPDQRRGLLRTDNVRVIFRNFYGYSDSGDGIFFCDPAPSHDKAEPGGSKYTCYMDGLTPLDMTGESLSVTGVSTFYSYDKLIDYIAGETRDITTTPPTCPDSDTSKGIDGWYRIFHDDRERNVGQATLLGGLLTFTTYEPSANLCTPEGKSYLYGLHYQTGSAWYQNIFGLNDYTYTGATIVNDRFDLGEGLSTTPSLHVGEGSDHDAKAFVQTSTGEIVEIEQEDLPLEPPKTGKQEWSDSCN